VRVIVCGGRRYYRADAIYDELDIMLIQHPDLIVIEGCQHGADELAGWHPPATHLRGKPTEHEFPGGWAYLRHRPAESALHFPADWSRHGKRAGALRNVEMLKARPNLVLAFHEDLPSSSGTKNMVEIATKAGVPVRLIE
jgi:hypothetical protein